MGEDHAIEPSLELLAGLDLAGLREAWPRRFGPPPRLRSADLLRRMLAWRLQAEAYGGLDVKTRKLLSKRALVSRGSRLETGARLVREWKGERCEVEITEEGVLYRGETFASLSEVARAITGSRWNGPRFFGLRGGRMSRSGLAVVAKPASLRCAVYTRKSSEEGLEQSFNSLHAQRDACEAYILSQAGEGWTSLPQPYDDGGISGGTMERPGLKALLADVERGRIDVVVVYKVDRLTRSLTDFARIVEAFDKAGVSFVSVTQAFNTTSSMGRLTLNVLLSFAQFEREVTGERIRDKIALSKAKGMWMGGVLPLGYDAQDHVLLENPAEAEVVRWIFKRYLQLGSVHRLCEALNSEGVRSKAWVTAKGRSMGGAPFSRGALFHLLQNRHYLGEIVHRDRTHPGLHAPILDRALFEAVQKRLASNRIVRGRGKVKVASSLLIGKLYDEAGERFSPTFSTGRSGRIHGYYTAADVQQGRPRERLQEGAIRRVGADALERFIITELRRISDRPDAGADALLPLLIRLELRPAETHLVLDQDLLFGDDHPELALEDLRTRLSPGERLVIERGAPAALRIALPRRMQLRGGRTWAFGGEGAVPTRPRSDPALIEALRRAQTLSAALVETAPSNPYDRKLVTLAFLAPDIQQAILQGRQPPEMTLARLLRMELPLCWAAQRRWVGATVQGQL